MSGDAVDCFRHSSPMERNRELMKSEKQGIGTILRSDSEGFGVAASLRRTLSADMSSERWICQQNLFPIKKIDSSAAFSVSVPDSSSEDDDYEERKGEFDIWSEIQAKKVKEAEKTGEFKVWSSIISQKVDDHKTLPLYIHPLVKRSSSSLSEKSLEICTESLGSETGSDGFSSYPESENGDIEEEEKKKPLENEKKESSENEEWTPMKPNYRKSSSRSFPPPLSTLSCNDGDSMRMQSRRDNGRLVLEAVSVPSPCNFLAKRQDGRLLLSLVQSSEFLEEFEVNDDGEEEEEFEEQFSDSDDEHEEEEEEEMDSSKTRVLAIETAREQPLKLSTGFSNIHRLAKFTGFSNMNVPWTNEEEEKAEQPWLHPMVHQATRRAPSVAEMAAPSLNDCEDPWRSNPGESNQGKNLSRIEQQCPSTKNNWSKVLKCNNGRRNYDEEKLNPFSNGCKQPKRSLLWKPLCIATS